MLKTISPQCLERQTDRQTYFEKGRLRKRDLTDGDGERERKRESERKRKRDRDKERTIERSMRV